MTDEHSNVNGAPNDRSMHPAFENVPCNCCGSTDVDVVFPSTLPQDLSLDLTIRYAPADHASGNDRIVRCRGCSLAFASPRMKPEYIWQGYSDATDVHYAAQEQDRIRTFARAIRRIERDVPTRGTLLDVGCAAGFFLKAARDAGWTVEGIEPNHGLAAWGVARYAVPIHSVPFTDFTAPTERFDVVTFLDVLEHVTDPRAYIRRALGLLRPGGYLYVNFPDFGSLLARIAGKRWWFLSPVHIYYFTRATLAQMLTAEGFAVIAMEQHYQTLPLGYLFERFAPYSATIARWGAAGAQALGISRLPIRYYASQALAVARKPRAM